jgi:hypothetical protein
LSLTSWEIVALREKSESYDSFSARSCIFLLAHEKTRTVCGISPHPHKQPALKQGIKIFPRQSTTTLVRQNPYKYLTSSRAALKVPHLNFSPIICHIWDLDGWSRDKGKSNFLKYIRVLGKWHRNFLIHCFGADCLWEWRNIPQTLRKKFTTFSTEQIVALRSVYKISRRTTVSLLVIDRYLTKWWPLDLVNTCIIVF